ncbi:MAG: hypothetical protein KA436_09325 [Oligoflexales bacterium]|nr:hypothetical protein [Oligoflexales bacterium]
MSLFIFPALKKYFHSQWFVLLFLSWGLAGPTFGTNARDLKKLEKIFRKISAAQPVLKYYIRNSIDLRMQIATFIAKSRALPTTPDAVTIKFARTIVQFTDALLAEMKVRLSKNSDMINDYRKELTELTNASQASDDGLYTPQSLDRSSSEELCQELGLATRFLRLEKELIVAADETWEDTHLSWQDFGKIKFEYTKIADRL